MTRFFNPPDVAKPGSRYWHGAAIPGGWRRLEFSGQVGARPDGTIPTEFEAQYRQVFQNIFAILRDGGFAVADLVKLVVYCTRTEDIPAARRLREEILGSHTVASTLVVVVALANPAFLVEIEGIAAAP
ncbi:MAG: RidA family protein [Alphaproteobacteria bacterium]|nr:RidA family protein [Alphaproteobacteria bacterium]